jgi:hypothetical protein
VLASARPATVLVNNAGRNANFDATTMSPEGIRVNFTGATLFADGGLTARRAG